MNPMLDVAIVGAGPYGLSIAAHFQEQGVRFGIFGPPMEVWREHMPKGMLLKSDGFASNLSSPGDKFTLKDFCRTRNIQYDDTRVPVRIETFIEYALAFQSTLVPALDPRLVAGIARTPAGYELHLEDGTCVAARRVILAVGVSYFDYVPESLSHLPSNLLSHSSAIQDCGRFRGRNVIVIGAGASAVDIATLLYESGAHVSLVARAPRIRFHEAPGENPRTAWQRMRNPSSGLGPGWKSRFFTDVPGLFRYFPRNTRLKIVKQHLGPAPGWPMKKRIEGKIPMALGYNIQQATAVNGGVRLTCISGDGQIQNHDTEHIIAATGYRPDVRRLKFLDATIRDELRTLANAPVLSSNFESSVPGLYFVGISAVYDFGPMMRFGYGSDYTARRVARHFQALG